MVILPSTVRTIGNFVFQNTPNLNNLVILNTSIPTIQANTFNNSGSGQIYVKNSVVDTYKNAGGYWNNVSTRITPLASATYDSSTNTVQASGRDTLELYIDSSLIDSSVYTFTPGATDEDHTVTVKSIDSSLGVLDTYETTVTITAQ
jgi:hypothetical protein